MKNSKILVLATSFLVALGVTACGGAKESGSKSGSMTAGTFVKHFSKSEMSGNIRHTGYLTNSESFYEENTLVLDGNGAYTYSKLVTNAPKVNALALKAASANQEFLAWTSVEADGSVLEFNADGTFNATAKAGQYELKAKGTWSWTNWTLKVTVEGGAEVTGTMDAERNLNVALDFGHSVIRNFTAAKDTWVAALGATGNYTPKASESAVTYFYKGSGSKVGGGVTYDATIEAYFLKEGSNEKIKVATNFVATFFCLIVNFFDYLK